MGGGTLQWAWDVSSSSSGGDQGGARTTATLQVSFCARVVRKQLLVRISYSYSQLHRSRLSAKAPNCRTVRLTTKIHETVYRRFTRQFTDIWNSHLKIQYYCRVGSIKKYEIYFITNFQGRQPWVRRISGQYSSLQAALLVLVIYYMGEFLLGDVLFFVHYNGKCWYLYFRWGIFSY